METSIKKIGFVIPWFGWDIPGGAETELRGLVEHLHAEGIEVEVLTTCVKEFTADWNMNYHKAKSTVEKGIVVRRFKADYYKREKFAAANIKLMNNEMSITTEEEWAFISENINSKDLYKYIRAKRDEYSLFVFIPYMFGTTYYGIQECFDKAVLIPCFHEESYIYMNIFKEAFSKVCGMAFLAAPEGKLAERVYDLSKVNHKVLGAGVDTEFTYDADIFRKKYHIEEPFLLYAGRKDVGKNIYTLIWQFEKYKKSHDNDLKLVLIGGGKVDVPDTIKDDVIDLGYIDLEDKFHAYAAALALCQPSKHESFSIVIMESWLCERPVLIHEECEVTKHFVESSNGGLYFSNYYEFEEEVDFLIKNPDIAKCMGQNGRAFVLENFAWDVIVRKYVAFFEELISGAELT